jgi:predicted enzyme related to lactoylglutathione lyase
MLAFADVEKAIEFYRDVFGFEVTESYIEDGRMVWCSVKAGQTEAMFQYHPRQAEKNGGTVFWLYTNDVDGFHARLKAMGWLVGEPETASGRREFETVDTESHPLMVCQVLDRPPEREE